MTSNSTRKRFAAVTAKLFVLLIAVCMVLAVAPHFAMDVLPVASADTVSYQVPSGASPATINSQLASYQSGTTVNMLLSSNISGYGITIPEGLTVNLYMNGKTISYSDTHWERDNPSTFQTAGAYGIINNGTLNVYSGSVSQPVLSNGQSLISLIVSKTGMDTPEDRHDDAYADLAAIKNTGTLTVNKSVKLLAHTEISYDDGGDSAHRAFVSSGATGVYNTSNSASVVLNDVEIESYAKAFGANANYNLFTTQRGGAGRALSYGVYGGVVTVNGGSKISTGADYGSTDDGAFAANFGRARCVGIAFGICSSQKIKVNGGEFSYSAKVTDDHKGMYNTNTRVFMGGIAYSSQIPDLTDGTIKVFNDTVNKISEQKNTTVNVFEAPVAKMTTLPVSGYEIVNSAALKNEYKENNDYFVCYDYYPNGTNSAGQFYDESGNVYDAHSSTTDGTHPKAIIRGAEDGTYRVHLIYRYWTTSNKAEVYTAEGNPGYSYNPTGDGTNIVNTALQLNGLSGSKLIKTKDSGIKYKSGGASKNDYYWKQFNITYATTSSWFSDYDVTDVSHRGTIFKSFVDTTDNSCGSGSESPLYIFMDYYRVAPTQINASVGSNNIATVTYTGDPIKASSLSNLKIKNAVQNTDYTAEYNIDFDNQNKIPVSFSWTGTNAAGQNVSNGSSNELPTDAGTYTVTLQIADSSTYDPNDCDSRTHKNRYALSYEFTLIIDQAPVTRNNLPETVTLTYGARLNETLTLNSYVAKGPKNENVTGSFRFSNPNDGSAFKNVGTGTVSLTWEPAYDTFATTKNYRETTFTVEYTVNKASIVISPKAAQVTYGETDFTTPFDIAVTGLVANDNNANAIGNIAAAIDYMILVNNSYIYYTPDDVSFGSYEIRARVKQAEVPDVLNNYNYSYADLQPGYEINQLTVAKRGLTVKATAVSRAYVPDDFSVSVTYEVVDGRYSADDVRFTAGSGSISYCTAGTQNVGGVTKNTASACMIGGKASCYQVAELIYATGTTLTVEITKATPTVSAPIVNDVNYQRGRILRDIPLENTSGMAGRWEWEDDSINPTVAVSAYPAKFIPQDENYAVKVVDVNLNVRPTPVKITYNGTVEYGDPVPNITAYTYTAELDPTFSAEGLETTGNITPATTYREGSAVNAEGYPVTITLQNYADAAGNYTFTAQNGKIVVTPRNIEFTVPNATIEYGENFIPTAANVTLNYDPSRLVGSDTINSITENGTEPTWNYSTDYTYQTNYQVGNYPITVTKTFNTSPNYTVSVVNGTLTVTKAALTIRANNVTLPYNSDIPADLNTAYTLIGAKRGEQISAILSSGTITVDTNYTKGASVNTEGYDVSVNISNAVFNNYNVTVENGKITVVKATPVIRTYPTASIVYGQTLADAVFTGSVIDGDVRGQFVYSAGTTKPAYSSEPYTNYTAAFIPTDTNNYNTVNGLAISLTVNKMSVTGALSVTGLPMVGETLTVDVSGMNPNTAGAYTFTWVMNGSTVGTGETLSLTNDHKGNAITVTAVAQGYYEGEKTYTITAVAPVLPSVETILNSTNYANYFDMAGLNVFGETTTVTYDAAQHDVTLTQKTGTLGNTVIGAITVKYNGSTEIPVNAGLYTVTVDVATPDLNHVDDNTFTTYSPATGLPIGTLKIDKAPYNVTVTVADKVYDGYNTATAANISENGAMTLAGNEKDDVAFDRDRVIYTFADANVGSDKTVNVGNEALTGSSAANYELNFTLANGAKASITKRMLNVNVDPVEREYQPNYYEVDLAFTVDTSTIAPADSSADVYVNEALATGTVDDYHAGTRRVSVANVALAGSKKDNYELNLTNVSGLTVEIEKATPTYPLPNTGIIYYDSGRTLSNISLGDSRWAWADVDANKIPEAGTHSFTAVYTPDDTDNYAAVNFEVALTVRKAPVVIKAASFTTIYGDYAPTYYYTVTGLTGSDTIKTSVGGYVIMSCAYEPGSDVGQYSIVLSGGFSSNNYSFTYQNGTINVQPRPAYVTAVAQSRPYEEGNQNVNVTFSELSNIFAGDASNVYMGGTQPVVGTIADANAGLKLVTYELPALAGSKADNYTLTVLNPELRVEITKVVLEGVVLPTSGTVRYGQKLSETVFTSSYAGEDLGTFSMENPMSTPAAVGTTNNVYKVVFTPNNTINFATISDYISLTVTTADLNVELSLSGSPEVGKKLYVTTNNIPEDALSNIVFKWYRLSSRSGDVLTGTLVASGTNEYTCVEKDADNYIVCVATGRAGSPYNITGRISSDSTVKQQSMSLWQRLLRWFYKVMASITQLFGRI